MNMPKTNKTSYDGLPALWRASDKASTAAQKQFVMLTAINLGLLIIAAVVGSLILNSTSEKMAKAILGAVLLTASIFVTIAIRMIRLEKAWYDGRAIAESIKTMAWRYVTGSDPYSLNLGTKADTLFISTLSSLLSGRNMLVPRLGSELSTGQQITDWMRMVRNSSTEERKKIYLSERIDDQRKWYGNNTKVNLRSANRFFAGTIASQALAIISAFLLIIWPVSPVAPTGIFTILAVVFLAWTQMRRNEEMAQSYGLAAQELQLIHEQAAEIKTDEELSVYVVNSENAISREHTMWLARRS